MKSFDDWWLLTGHVLLFMKTSHWQPWHPDPDIWHTAQLWQPLQEISSLLNQANLCDGEASVNRKRWRMEHLFSIASSQSN